MKYDDEPPRIDGRDFRDDAPDPRLQTQRVLSDIRTLLCLPLLASTLVSQPKLTNVQRAEAAWDQIDALLEVRKQRRAAYAARKRKETGE